MDDRRGERFGRYEILSELGRGAVGVVYKARDPKINRVVAIKTFSLSGQAPEDEQEFRERFVREAEAAGRLSHPGIVTIFDVGEEPDSRAPYIVMEYVGGQSLDKVLAANDNRLPLETALQLTLELAEALDCAHGQGVVHRDLKPANILITEDGHPKIADFGVAKLNLANQTLAGRTLGTPAYMSPEQLNGDTVDGRSDLFSLGVVLYTVLTGYRPFQGNSAMTVSFKVVNRDPVPASVLDTELPPVLDYIIGKAMAKDPAQRYQRGMELALDIQDLRAGREPWTRGKEASTSAAAALPFIEKKVTAAKVTPAKATATKGGVAGAVRSIARPHRGSGLGPMLIEALHRKSFATGLLVVGLIVFALRMVPMAHRKKATPTGQMANRMAGPSAVNGNSAGTKSAGSTADLRPAVAELIASNPADSAQLPTSEGEVPQAAIAQAPAPQAPTPKPKGTHHTPAPKPDKVQDVAEVRAAANPKAVHAAASAATIQPATLDIEIEHKFVEASLSIWVDSHLSYTHALEGIDKKKLIVFHSVQGHEFHAMQVPPGKHQLRVQVTAQANPDHSGTVAGEFFSGKEKTLRILFDKHGEMNLNLE